MKINTELLNEYYNNLNENTKQYLNAAISKIVDVKKSGGKVMAVTGSGPNIHEGVTTLIAELMAKDIIDSVSTSSAVIAHEMAGSLDKVKRVNAAMVGIKPDSHFLPRGNVFEFTLLEKPDLDELRNEMILDEKLLKKGMGAKGNIIIKAAGNMGYPMGLRTEIISNEILRIAQVYGLPFEEVAGWGADLQTMIGIGAIKRLPVLVTVPQLIGGGTVGLCIGDSIPISERCMRISRLIEEADLIIESAVALTQEIHDGPFECYTGHGIWAFWNGLKTCSLRGKTLIRIDLDKNLRKAKIAQEKNKQIQKAIDQGLPKTKITSIPFRMEMSGFARLEGSIPIVGDIGEIWPIIAWRVADALGIALDFISYPQQSKEGKQMRDLIVKNIKPLNRKKILKKAKEYDLKKESNLEKP